jgi:hypothetical protein
MLINGDETIKDGLKTSIKRSCKQSGTLNDRNDTKDELLCRTKDELEIELNPLLDSFWTISRWPLFALREFLTICNRFRSFKIRICKRPKTITNGKKIT